MSALRSRGPIVATVVLVVGVAAVIVATVAAHRASAVTSARAEALAAAKERVPALLGYDAATLDEIGRAHV